MQPVYFAATGAVVSHPSAANVPGQPSPSPSTLDLFGIGTFLILLILESRNLGRYLLHRYHIHKTIKLVQHQATLQHLLEHPPLIGRSP